jgi:hypothetical protein
MGFFDGFSSRQKADSTGQQKRDSQGDFWPGKTARLIAVTG